MASVGGEGKSGDGKTRGIDNTFGIGGRVVEEKKEDSSKNVTSAEIK